MMSAPLCASNHGTSPLRRHLLHATTSCATIAVILVIAGCSAERNPDAERQPKLALDPVAEPRIRPGPAWPGDTLPGPHELSADNPYQSNAYAIQEGYRLFHWMNCVGCHAEGGGSIGPALWDDEWIYGGAPSDIAESILRGRPNGMPAFAGKIPETEVWKLVAYLQALKPGGGISKEGIK